MDDQTHQVPSEPIEKPEDAELEKEALAETKDDAIRAKLVEKIGIADIAENAEYLDKLVAYDKEHRQKLSTAIRQKQGYREQAKKPKPAEERPIVKQPPVEDVSKLVDSRLDERLDDEKLREIDLTDEAKKDLRAYAKVQNVTVRQALTSPYFQYLKDQADKAKREEDASASRNTKTPARKTFDPDKPPKVDMSTPEGRKEWDEYMAAVSKS